MNQQFNLPIPNPGEVTTDVAHIQINADVPVGATVLIRIEAVREDHQILVRHDITTLTSPAQKSSALQQVASQLRALALKLRIGDDILQRCLFAGALLVYLAVILIGIERFPMFFFTDEAVHANHAENLWAHELHGPDGELLPTYFQVDASFGLNGTSVYLQLIPLLLFGKSVLVTRVTAALITLLGAVSISLLLRHAFRIPTFWISALLLASSPAWFIHARTAFEYMLVASFYAATLYCYHRYRNGEDRFLYWTLLAGSLTFYSHGLAQILIALTGAALFISDLRYHLAPQRRRVLIRAAGLLVLLALPYLRFQLQHSDVISTQIRQRGSYWMDSNLTFADKLLRWLGEYLYGLSPQFWFLPNDRDLSRHTIPGLGNLPLITAPFALLGIVESIRRFRTSAYRNVLLALLIAPIPATIVAIGTPRTLWVIVPWVILIAIGFNCCSRFVENRRPHIVRWLQIATFAALSINGLLLLQHSLTESSHWYTDFGLYGQQYGAQQVFGDTVAPMLAADPNAHFVISPSWANGTDQLLWFFVSASDIGRLMLAQPINLIDRRSEVTSNTYFIATSDEYKKLIQEPIFTNIDVKKVILYPNGQEGFYVLTLAFSPDADKIIAQEHAKLRTPIHDTFDFQGKQAEAMHSPFGEGRLENIFDGDPTTLVRGAEANPIFFDVTLPDATTVKSLDVRTGSMSDFTVTAHVYPLDGTNPIEVSKRFIDLPSDPQITLDLPSAIRTQRFMLEVKDHTRADTAEIHVREITLR
ncbi:MAG: hypothetical protein NTZ50_10630 [Chloroflexi bacterium]|nr:hypothetical protein [Chloroflexota bacterium]